MVFTVASYIRRATAVPLDVRWVNGRMFTSTVVQDLIILQLALQAARRPIDLWLQCTTLSTERKRHVLQILRKSPTLRRMRLELVESKTLWEHAAMAALEGPARELRLRCIAQNGSHYTMVLDIQDYRYQQVRAFLGASLLRNIGCEAARIMHRDKGLVRKIAAFLFIKDP